MMTTITIMRPWHPTEHRDIAHPVGLDQIRAALAPYLDGGEPEHVSVLHDGRRADMFVDNMGLIKRLARNERATAIYRACSMSKNPTQNPEDLPWIVGPAVLFSRIVWR